MSATAPIDKKVPSVPLFDGAPDKPVNLAELLMSDKAVLVGVPGAFSQPCSEEHLPNYIVNFPAFIEKGYHKLIVFAVNDPFVMAKWKKSLVPEGTVGEDDILFLADPDGKFNKELGTLFDASAFFGNWRGKRCAFLVTNGEITKEFIEPDNVSVKKSAFENVIKEAPASH